MLLSEGRCLFISCWSAQHCLTSCPCVRGPTCTLATSRWAAVIISTSFFLRACSKPAIWEQLDYHTVSRGKATVVYSEFAFYSASLSSVNPAINSVGDKDALALDKFWLITKKRKIHVQTTRAFFQSKNDVVKFTVCSSFMLNDHQLDFLYNSPEAVVGHQRGSEKTAYSWKPPYDDMLIYFSFHLISLLAQWRCGLFFGKPASPTFSVVKRKKIPLEAEVTDKNQKE